MTLEFDYEKFALDMFEQSKPLIPKDLTAIQKTYVSNIVLNYTKRAGEALYKEKDSTLNARQKMLIAQAIAEWLFHKAIDSLRAGVPSKYVDCIMEKIAFITFEVTKQGCLKNTPENKLLGILEQNIKKAYKEKILELKEARCVDEHIAKNALKQSNIDRMYGPVANKTTRGWNSLPR